jgi:hypothetical protein
MMDQGDALYSICVQNGTLKIYANKIRRITRSTRFLLLNYYSILWCQKVCGCVACVLAIDTGRTEQTHNPDNPIYIGRHSQHSVSRLVSADLSTAVLPLSTILVERAC